METLGDDDDWEIVSVRGEIGSREFTVRGRGIEAVVVLRRNHAHVSFLSPRIRWGDEASQTCTPRRIATTARAHARILGEIARRSTSSAAAPAVDVATGESSIALTGPDARGMLRVVFGDAVAGRFT